MRRNAKLDDIDAAINRCHSKIYRVVNLMHKLETARKRLKAKAAEAADPATLNNRTIAEQSVVVAEPGRRDSDDPLELPTFLKRSLADEAAAAAIKADIEAKKAAKAKASAAKSKAKARGELRKMPLQGKAALAAIRGES